jgi:hypothetical protein
VLLAPTANLHFNLGLSLLYTQPSLPVQMEPTWDGFAKVRDTPLPVCVFGPGAAGPASPHLRERSAHGRFLQWRNSHGELAHFPCWEGKVVKTGLLPSPLKNVCLLCFVKRCQWLTNEAGVLDCSVQGMPPSFATWKAAITKIAYNDSPLGVHIRNPFRRTHSLIHACIHPFISLPVVL